MYTSGLFQTVTYKLYETEKEEKLWLFANCGPVLLMHANITLRKFRRRWTPGSFSRFILKSLQFGGWCSLRLDLRSTVHSQAKPRFFAGQMNKDACVDNARRTRQAALDELPYWLKVLRLLTTGLASYFSPKCFASKFMITYRPRQLRSSIPRLTSNSLADTSLWTR